VCPDQALATEADSLIEILGDRYATPTLPRLTKLWRELIGRIARALGH
jgi:hypothetical protein